VGAGPERASLLDSLRRRLLLQGVRPTER
jgi:hypothetical protein